MMYDCTLLTGYTDLWIFRCVVHECYEVGHDMGRSISPESPYICMVAKRRESECKES